ncbi:MAG: polysaccharide deacetylase family protein [Acidobacteriota bacterium]
MPRKFDGHIGVRRRLIDTGDRVARLVAIVGDGLVRRCGRPRHYILNYHHVAPATNELVDGLGVHLDLDVFASHLHFLSARFRFVSLRTLISGLEADRAMRPSVALTFDDGFRCVIEHVAPLLCRVGACATLFPPIASMGNKRLLVPQKLALLKNRGCGERDLQHIRSVRPALLEQAVSRVFESLGWREDQIAQDHRLYLDAEDIAADSGVFEHGSHGLAHVDLTVLDDAALREELVESRRQLEAMTGRAVDVLALPFGKYDDRVVGFAREAGYRSLLSLEERPITAGQGVTVLPRYIGENIGGKAIDETLTTSVRFRSLRHGLRAWRWGPQ